MVLVGVSIHGTPFVPPVPVDFSFVQEKSNDTVCYCLYIYRGGKSVGHTLSLLYIHRWKRVCPHCLFSAYIQGKSVPHTLSLLYNTGEKVRV